jgi:acylphosphatase
MDEYLQARVEGVVQGVGFRYYVLHKANALGLAGFVRNLPDGSVEVEAEGPKATLDKLCALLEEGPMSARVRNVQKSWGETQGKFSEFEVRY